MVLSEEHREKINSGRLFELGKILQVESVSIGPVTCRVPVILCKKLREKCKMENGTLNIMFPANQERTHQFHFGMHHCC
jgi:hypothetical protein